MSTPLEKTTLSATARLELSRGRLRQALEGRQRRSSGTSADKVAGLSAGLLDNLKSLPLVSIFTEAVASWWSQHPLRLVGILGASMVKTAAKPIARRNPWGLALAAVLVGGFLAWKRPWRWVLRPALFAGLGAHLLSKGITHLPLQDWLNALSARAPHSPPAVRSERVG